MPTGLPDIEMEPTEEEGACVEGGSTADVLRLLSGGAAGAILMALGEGPLRTKSLTEQVPGYAKRTIYRYTGKLTELDIIAREEQPGVPSKVVHSLTDGCGRELYELVDRYADASLTRLPDGRIDAHAWASLGLLADLWETGMVGELACESRTATELAEGEHGLSYHQVQRRASQFRASGLLEMSAESGSGRRYALTRKGRRKMSLVAGIARWRHRHVVAEDEEGMTAAEMATALRAALPLVRTPDHSGSCLRLSVHDEGGEGEEVWAEVEPDGTVQSCVEAPADPHAWADGRVANWIPALLEGRADSLDLGGEEPPLRQCLESLHQTLWTPAPA